MSFHIECKISLNYIVHKVKSGKIYKIYFNTSTNVVQALSQLGRRVQLANSQGIHILEEGGQLWTILFLPLEAALHNGLTCSWMVVSETEVTTSRGT